MWVSLACKPVYFEPGNRESCGRKSIWHMNILGVWLARVCVAAAGPLVVIQ